MNILFLTISKIDSLNQRGIYPDLLRSIIKQGHNVHIVAPLERRFRNKTHFLKFDNNSILKVRTLNIQKTNIIEKGIATLLIEKQFNKAINKYYRHLKFDLILYSTPPITFTSIIEKIKYRHNANTYLLLKDIFPQNAVDIGMMSKSGFLYRYFRKKEKKLYKLSDYIGCMSPANVKYILTNNTNMDSRSVEVCPNSTEVSIPHNSNKQNDIRSKFGIPSEAVVFIYGGNLGKPQGLDFLLQILSSNQNKQDRFFIIIGSGTEYNKISQWFMTNQPDNSILLTALPKKEYDELVESCDVGMILLDPRFTIPNYPSRLLSYLENKMPVLMATDINTDIGPIAQENNYGLWCKNGDLETFNSMIYQLCSDRTLIPKMGEKGYQYLLDNYQAHISADIILSHFLEKSNG